MLRNIFTGGFSFNSIIFALFRVIIILFAICIHEMAHGYMAYKLGDNTAKYDGRLSLNPLHHIDPFGALCMLFFGFGWAKPVRINISYFKKTKRDTVLTALAGPLSNFLMAYIGMILFIYVCPTVNSLFLSQFIFMFIMLNIGLGAFNLIPIPPLDGSKIFLSLLPRRIYYEIMRYERYGFIVLIVALYLGVLDRILTFAQSGIYTLLFYCAGGGLL